MRAAIYSRVSTERQERQQTIGSQVSALRDWAAAQGHVLAEAHVFRDEGYSGSRLDRPALDALRDAVRDAAVDVVAVFSPDRLARKYAYQVLLLEEFRRAGCEVVFLHHPISDDPNDQLLLQIQGAIAEYERAVLAERFRRGKLQKARDGHIISSKVPYGYRYEARHGAVPARLVIDETEAAMVRELYAWVLEDGLTIRQCTKRLNAGPWVTRSGREQWAPSVVHHILTEPVYAGTAYANRFDYVVPRKPRSRSRRSAERCSRRLRPPEQWIAIGVPPLVDHQTWDRVHATLARNAATAFRRNKKHDYLLRCLLKCGKCGLGLHGCYFPAQGGRSGKRYYRCAGADPLTTGREAKCPRAYIQADGLEQAVWRHVVGLLRDPAQVLAQFERFSGEAVTEGENAAAGQLRARIERMNRADRRLLEAYQSEVISLEELSGQRSALAEQRRLAEQQYEHHRHLSEQRLKAKEALEDLAAFSERISSRLQTANFAERQAILKLVVERIIVHDDALEIQHVIPLRGHTPGNGLEPSGLVGLRSDGVGPTRSLGDRPRSSIRLIQGVVAGIGIGLQDAGIAGQVPVRVLGCPVARVAEHRGRRRLPTKGPVIADIGPDPAGDGLASGQHGDGGVVAVQPRGGEDMGVDQGHQRRQVGGAGADPVGDGGDAELDPLQGIGLALAVQRQVLAELGLEDHRQQVRPRPAAGDRMERCRRLGDGLAGAAGEPLADGLDHLPPDGLDLERLRDVLAQLGQLAAAAGTGGRAGDDDPLARQVGRQGRPRRLAPGRAVRAAAAPILAGCVLGLGGILAGGDDQLPELELHLVDQLAAALGGGAEPVALEPGDQQLEVRHHRLGAGGARLSLAPRQLLSRECAAQCGDVLGQVVRRGRHARDGITAAARQVVPMQPRCTLSRQLRPECSLRVPPIDSVEHVSQLRPGDLHAPSRR
jgi:site-specific DNA recombinase